MYRLLSSVLFAHRTGQSFLFQPLHNIPKLIIAYIFLPGKAGEPPTAR
jgi:hypothetical protein